ncbi:MAG: hypothetical protein LKF31_08790 [Muribaculaceae bacterium]|jgi:lipopolysaccharide export system protein LptA|nr:hypothetical protein [Muribaculaceae bacterium]
MASRKILNNIGHKISVGILCLLGLFAVDGIVSGYSWAQMMPKNQNHQMPSRVKIKARHPKTKINRITPQIPKANRYQKNRVFLEYADALVADAMHPDYEILRGHVQFRKGGMFMYCDSAFFYDKTSSLDAFGHVKMKQGDTLFVYSDVLYYNGNDELAQLRHNVKMINRDVTLITDSLDYDMVQNLGYYFDGGKIVDSKNQLSSIYGQYEPKTKNAEFLFDVQLYNKDYTLRTDTLHYNTRTHISDIVGQTRIISDSTIVYTDKGWYNTNADNATLFHRSLIVGKQGQKLTGDTVFYDRKKGYGEAFGNILLTDSVHKSLLDGGYGYHNEKLHTSFATKHARAREFSKGDTLYLHGDTLRTYLIHNDSSRILCAYPRARFFRSNVQGLADSMSFVQTDSMLNMYRHPIVWSDNRQITGNEINVHIADSTVDYATLPNFGLMAEKIDSTQDKYYNQLAGKEMKAYFIDGELRKLDVSGNVQTLFYPMENDSTYNKLVFAESSFLKVLLKPKQELEKITMWPDVSGNVTPLYLAKRSQFYLAGFKWYDSLRPKKPDDIFDTSGMGDLMSEPSASVRHKSIK